MAKSRFKSRSQNMFVRNDTLYFKSEKFVQEIVPRENSPRIKSIIEKLHGQSHYGIWIILFKEKAEFGNLFLMAFLALGEKI